MWKRKFISTKTLDFVWIIIGWVYYKQQNLWFNLRLELIACWWQFLNTKTYLVWKYEASSVFLKIKTDEIIRFFFVFYLKKQLDLKFRWFKIVNNETLFFFKLAKLSISKLVYNNQFLEIYLRGTWRAEVV